MMDKEKIEIRKDWWQTKLDTCNYATPQEREFWQTEIEICDLAIKGLKQPGYPTIKFRGSGEDVATDALYLLTDPHQRKRFIEKVCGEQSDAIIGCALEQAAKVCDSANNFDNPMSSHDCAAAIRSLNEPALKAWEGVKQENEELKRRVKRGNEVLESYEARFAAIDAERAKAAT